MIYVANRFIPFKGFTSMAIFPFIFIREDSEHLYTRQVDNHENIHGMQQVELGFFGLLIAGILFFFGCGWWSLLGLPLYYYWYGIEWLIKFCYYRNAMTAYKNVGFEREAYDNMNDINYFGDRELFSWTKYIKV